MLNIGDKLVKKDGTEVTDKFGKALHVGDWVMHPSTCGSRSGRSDTVFARVVYFNRHPQLVSGLKEPLQEVLDRLNRGEYPSVYIDGVSTPYITKVSERFMKGFKNGTIFE